MRLTLLIGLAAAGTLLYSRLAQGSVNENAYDESTPPDPMTANANVAAFLALIRRIEPGPEGYNALVGGGRFDDFTDHPANLGWPGVRRDDGRLTTAAGAYQITRTTWNSLRALHPEALPDFTPQSQDSAAVFLIQGRGAYNLIGAGHLDAAIERLRGEWEAFDRMAQGTYPVTLAQAQTYYTDNGGTIA